MKRYVKLLIKKKKVHLLIVTHTPKWAEADFV